VRKHLANAYEKTGLKNQATLAATISRLNPPV
jgi:DNA-binding CsgD family transcriptional regulator